MPNHYFRPENTIISFDLHGVLFNHDFKKMFYLWWYYPARWKFLFHLCNPRIWICAAHLSIKGTIAEHLLVELIQHFPHLQQYRQLGIKLLNAQKIDPNMANLVTKLKNAGYMIHLFSNIGQNLFVDLQAQFPTYFDLFDHIYFTNASNNYIAKPHDQAYKNYLKSFQRKEKKIIFIDNKRKNAKAAEKFDIFGIYFKSIDKLNAELSLLFIFVHLDT